MSKVLHIIRFILVYKMPTKINDYIVWAFGKYNSMHSNSRYAPLSDKLDDLNTANVALDTAQKGTKTTPPTVSTADRDKCLETAKMNMRIVGGSVQQMADDDPENAEITIKEADFDVKEVSVRQKQQFKAEDGPEAHSVLLYGDGAGPHNWRTSLDGQTWVVLLGSKNARKILRNLTPKTYYYFQSSPMMNDGEEGVWSDTICYLAK